MGAPLRGGEVMRSGLDDLVTFNHWLCLTRLRAAGAVMLFTLGLAWLRVGNISTPYACAVCAGLFAVSGIGLSWPSLARVPRLFFYLQSLADLAAITVGIGISVHGFEALLFRSVYALTIVPASLISVPSGLAVAAAATIGHEMLLVHERGLVPGTLYGVESPVSGWAPVRRLAAQPLIVLNGAEAERTPGFGTRGGPLSTTILAALYREHVLVGFLAVGFRSLSLLEREQAVEFLSGIAQHATIVLRNARLLEELQLASAMKSEFVGAISHALRSPLNVMYGYLEMTLDGAFGPITAEQRHALGRTREQSLALLEMITALLDMNRLEAGRLPVQRARVSVAQLLEEVCWQVPESWRRPEVLLRRALAPGLPEIETDAGKLKTVVRNLLHNAFKFTERGQVTLGAGLTPAGDLAITVADTGCGMAPDAIQYIFDMFRQVPGSGGGGVGLGLYLVRRLLHVLGGTVSVASEVGKGTCFTVILPLAAASGQRPSRRSPGPLAPSANAA